MPQRQEPEVAARIARGERLIDFDDLLIEWSDFRLVFRQTADILHRAGVIESSDQAALQDLVRTGHRVEPLARDYYERTAHPDRYAPPAETEPGMIDEVLSLSMKPFLARCAEVWGPRVPLDQWRRGWCPLCGLYADFGTITDGDLLLICGRCTVQWPYDIGTVRVLRPRSRSIVRERRWPLSRAWLQPLQEVPEGVRHAGRARARYCHP